MVYGISYLGVGCYTFSYVIFLLLLSQFRERNVCKSIYLATVFALCKLNH